MRRLDRGLAAVEAGVIALLCAIALGLGIMQVVLRYVFNTGVHWNEAVFVTVTIWAILIGASRAIRDNLHARVDVLAEAAPPIVSKFCNLVALVSALGLSALYLVCGYYYVSFLHQLDIVDVDSGIPSALTYAIVPIAMALFVVRYMVKLIVWFRDPREYESGGDAAAGGV